MRKCAALALLCFALGCRDRVTQQPPPPPPPEPCGDGIINAAEGEECEGSDLGGASCQSLGADTGALSCGADCRFVRTQCVKRCGNGALDTGEACDGDAGLSSCATFGYRACTDACQLDGTHCVALPLASAPALQQTKGGPSAVADLSPPGAGDLVLAVPSFGRLAIFAWSVQQGFGTSPRLLSFGRTPVLPLGADVDGDGSLDVAALNDDGSADRYRANGSGFSLEGLPDAGCAASRWLGAGERTDAGQRLFALGCTDGGLSDALLRWEPGAPSAAQLTALGGLAGGTLADFDGDGRSDALLVRGQQLVLALGSGADAGAPVALPLAAAQVAAADFDGDGDLDLAVAEAGTGTLALLENTGGAFALRGNTATAAPLFLAAQDLDLDGRPDLAFYEAGAVQVRRNQGGFVFSTYALSSGAGALLSFSVADVDGDGDPDFVTTHSSGGEATTTFVVLNKVR